MPIYLVQHGKSFTKEENPDRPLTEEGGAIVSRIAGIAAAHHLKVDEIRHSGKTRARQTAEILAEFLKPAKGIQSCGGMDPLDDVVAFSSSLPAEDRVLWVGHLPFLERLASCLITGDPEHAVLQFQNAGIVALERRPETGKWIVLWTLMPELR